MSTRWENLAADDQVAGYDRRMAENLRAVVAAGGSPYAEADLVVRLLPAGGTVLDAGCGTGRVAWRLAELGLHVIGVDADPRMLALARDVSREANRAAATTPVWMCADVTTYRGDAVDLVLAAGNVLPLLAPGTLEATIGGLTDQLRPGGLLVAGYGLDTAHLPKGCPVTSRTEIDRAYTAAGLSLRARWGTWEGGPFTGEYAVDVTARLR